MKSKFRQFLLTLIVSAAQASCFTYRTHTARETEPWPPISAPGERPSIAIAINELKQIAYDTNRDEPMVKRPLPEEGPLLQWGDYQSAARRLFVLRHTFRSSKFFSKVASSEKEKTDLRVEVSYFLESGADLNRLLASLLTFGMIPVSGTMRNILVLDFKANGKSLGSASAYEEEFQFGWAPLCGCYAVQYPYFRGVHASRFTRLIQEALINAAVDGLLRVPRRPAKIVKGPGKKKTVWRRLSLGRVFRVDGPHRIIILASDAGRLKPGRVVSLFDARRRRVGRIKVIKAFHTHVTARHLRGRGAAEGMEVGIIYKSVRD